MDQIIIHIRLYATHYKFNSLKPFIAEWTNERSIPQNNNYMIFVGGVGDGGVMNSQLASREFWELKWKSRRMKSACFLHRGYEDGFIWVRSWKFVSGGEWFDLYNCGMPNVWNNRYSICLCVCVYWYDLSSTYTSVSIFYTHTFGWHRINRNDMKVNRCGTHMK